MKHLKNVIPFQRDELKEVREANLQYYLLSPRNPPPEYSKLHDDVFEFWLGVWRPVLAGLGYSDTHLHEDFIRQDIISCICSNEEVVGAFLYSFFSLDIKATTTFRYMDNYPEIFFKKIQKLGVKTVMATQYLAVHPDWRGKKNPPVPLGLIIAGLSNRVRDEYGVDAGIGPTRRDHKVTELFYAHGGDCIIANVENHNVSCDMIANIRGRTHEHASPKIRKIEDMLWANRIDATAAVQILKNKKSA